ncbi:MAG: DUF4082 domain-containing protein [Myxococcaceae bacterium]|nr:DUF4082 domain-containing protein [Myxococcaceae bacterium]
MPVKRSATWGRAIGTRLATATFTNETASGWQQVDFATLVAQGASVAQSGRYLQYRALLSTTDSSVTPSLQEVHLGTPTAASSP